MAWLLEVVRIVALIDLAICAVLLLAWGILVLVFSLKTHNSKLFGSLKTYGRYKKDAYYCASCGDKSNKLYRSLVYWQTIVCRTCFILEYAILYDKKICVWCGEIIHSKPEKSIVFDEDYVCDECITIEKTY